MLEKSTPPTKLRSPVPAALVALLLLTVPAAMAVGTPALAPAAAPAAPSAPDAAPAPVAVDVATQALGQATRASQGPPPGQGPAQEAVTIRLNFSGVATRTDGGPDDGFMFRVEAEGDGTRYTPPGNGNAHGVQVRAQGLSTQVTIVRNSDNAIVEEFTVLVRFHANQASHLAQGLDGFRFHLEMTGPRDQAVQSNDAHDGRILAFNSHGTTIGEAEEDGHHLVEGRGQATTQPGGQGSGAAHYNLLLGGTASIESA